MDDLMPETPDLVFALYHPAVGWDEASFVTRQSTEQELPLRAAIYIVRYCEEIFRDEWGRGCQISERSVAELLVRHYGDLPVPGHFGPDRCGVIDMYLERDYCCRPGGLGEPHILLADGSLDRPGLADDIIPHLMDNLGEKFPASVAQQQLRNFLAGKEK